MYMYELYQTIYICTQKN